MPHQTDAESEDDDFLASLGLSGAELLAITTTTLDFFADEQVKAALEELCSASPETADRICQSLMRMAFSGGFSQAGKYLAVAFPGGGIGSPLKLPDLLEQVLAAPVTHRDMAHWWLLMSALAASVRFQTRLSGKCSLEPTLTGGLLECLSAKSEEWGKPLMPLMERAGAALSLQGIDLQVLGGEQESGGDFGLILDFDGKTVLPVERDDRDPRRRIVPLVLQAKRYKRPMADISQFNLTRGYQKDLLASNDCASAFIFYEDGTKPISRPLPPLIKRVEDAHGYGQANALEDSLDLPSYLLRCATDDSYAAAAASPEDALRMIFSTARAGQLRELVVISGDPRAGDRYSSALALLEPEINGQSEPPLQTAGFD